MYFRDGDQFKEMCGYEIDGAWYPRVTKIVDIKAKPALYKFYAEVGLAAGNNIKNKSASEGTLIHETFEKILTGESPVIDQSIAPAITAAVNFLEQNHIHVDPEYVERRVANYQHRYAGTIDTLALISGKFGILDIKTSMAIYRDYNLQTAAYMDALVNQFKNLQTRWIMRIDQARVCTGCNSTLRGKGGRDKIRAPYPRPAGWQACPAPNPNQSQGQHGADPKGQHAWSDVKGFVELKEFPYWHDDFQAFLGAKKLWEWENDFWLRKIGYV